MTRLVDWLHALPVVWMTLVIFGLWAVATLAIHRGVMRFAAGGRATVLARVTVGLLPPLGTVFGLLTGFLALQAWEDSQRARDAVVHEASALREVLIVAPLVSAEVGARMRAAITRHVELATTVEWPAMSNRTASFGTVSEPLLEALRVCLAAVPETPGQAAAQQEMVRSLHEAFDARRQRIVISQSSINWVKWSVLTLPALLVLATIAMVHCEAPKTAAVEMAVFALAVAASTVLIASHSRPFTGEISISADLLRQVVIDTAPVDRPGQR